MFMSSVPVELQFKGCGLKLKTPGAYLGIHKKVAAYMENKICVAFDIANNELDFVKIKELGNEKPDFKQFNRDILGKELLQIDNKISMIGGKNPKNFLPYKILMSDKASRSLSKVAFWAHGKLKDVDENKVDSISDLKKQLGQITVWCLYPRRMEDNSIAAENPDMLEDFDEEEQKRYTRYFTINSGELAMWEKIPFFKESLELANNG